MATIPKPQWRTSALTSAVARLQRARRPKWHPAPQVQNHVVSVIVSSSMVAAPEEPGEVVGSTPQVPLVRILDSFRQLEDPKSRVVGGFFYGSTEQLTTESAMDEVAFQQVVPGEQGGLMEAEADSAAHPHAVFSGVASPGSKVSVTIADEVGQPIETRTVYTDAGGNWLAPFGRLSTLDESGLISIEVQPTTWGGQATPSFMMFDFPAQKIIEHGEQGREGESNFFAAVFEGTDPTENG
jgi:hypothetical protein